MITTTTTSKRIARFVAMPALAAGIAGAALLGLAGPASATATAPQPGIVAAPSVKAAPAANATPGNWWHRHHPSLLDHTAATNFRAPGI